MNDYIRFPSRFDHIEEQLDRLEKTPDSVQVTLSLRRAGPEYLLPSPTLLNGNCKRNLRKLTLIPKARA